MKDDVNTLNDPARRSWVDDANGKTTDFPIQNLPFGIFSRTGSDVEPRIGVAIGESILDLKGCEEARLLPDLSPPARCSIHAPTLNDLMKLGRNVWREVRSAVSNLLEESNGSLRDDAALREELLIPQPEATMHLPATVGDYTDFYASIHHATNVGSMFRPDNPLLPNYRNLPVGYHGRASSIVVSGTPVRRPMGQLRPDDTKPPVFDACRLLDYEMEMGFFIGPGNDLGRRIAIASASDHIFGMVIVNDWSARDVQKWEYQPLGPFNAKNFATTISPWVVTLDALEPFRFPGPDRGDDDPPVLDYLAPVDDLSLDITCEVWLRSQQMRDNLPSPRGRHGDSPAERRGAGGEGSGGEGVMLSRGSFRHMYWTIAQMLVHHASTGCNLRPGDLIASGTVSGPEESARGCLLERTWRGQNPIELPDGTERKFLQDGDEVVMRCFCERDGAARIGFGECRGVVLPAE